jgi:hypothetical protein
MVNGLNVFRDYFRDYADRYILIGGTACDLAMNEAGDFFRATKDLDIVLCVEALDDSFVNAFWSFIRAGRYRIKQKSAGEKQFYRFQNPENRDYPLMLELFSRKPDALTLANESHLTPIPVSEDVSSLSAILLNDDYYRFILAGRTWIDTLPTVNPDRLIPLKARAWIDLTERKQRGEAVDSKDIKKHRNDVFRLYRIMQPDSIAFVPEAIMADMREFVFRIKFDEIDLKMLGFGEIKLETILADIRRIYGLGDFE